MLAAWFFVGWRVLASVSGWKVYACVGELRFCDYMYRYRLLWVYIGRARGLA
jgi:hypothetical protein